MEQSGNERLTLLERNHRHVERVVTTQREMVDRAVDGVRHALLEQAAGLRAHGAETRDQLRDLEARVDGLEGPHPAP